MPHKAKNHEEMQKCVCVMCFKKPKNLRNLTPRIVTMLGNLVLNDYKNEEKWDWLPKVICVGCCVELTKGTAEKSHQIQHIDYESLTRPQVMKDMKQVMTRRQVREVDEALASSAVQQCHCSLCLVGRLSWGLYNKYRSVVIWQVEGLQSC